MNIFIPFLMLGALVMAEPPVGDGYPASRSSDHQEKYDISHEYSIPSSPTDGYNYNAPSTRSQKYAPPAARVSFTQRFSSRSNQARNQDYPNSISQEYGTPSARSFDSKPLSQEYVVPNSRTSISSSLSARTLSSEYGVPDARSTPSQEYGAVLTARSNQKTQSDFPSTKSKSLHNIPKSYDLDEKSFARNAPSSTYGAPLSRSLSTSYGVPSGRNFESYSQEHNAESQSYSSPNQRGLSDTYGVPSARNTESYSQNHNALSQTYGPPDHSDSFEVASARGLSQEYGAPSLRANLKTDAVVSSYASGRTAPSLAYLPSARDSPSQQYGPPDANQGYDDASARALEELLNHEPANYEFSYQIDDQEGGEFGHSESREEDSAHGSYFVVLPDGTKQTVEYEADEEGFKPRISLEPVGGYDQNASDGTNNGPY